MSEPALKKYFIITRDNKIEYIGNFTSFKDAYDYAEYDSEINFIWIINEFRLREFRDTINKVLDNL